MEHDYFAELFDGLPRCGAGSDDASERALQLVQRFPLRPNVADLGCGPGRSTLILAAWALKTPGMRRHGVWTLYSAYPGRFLSRSASSSNNLHTTSPYRRCGPTLSEVTVAAYRGSDQFWSLDVRQMEQYPQNVAPLIPPPMVFFPRHFICL